MNRLVVSLKCLSPSVSTSRTVFGGRKVPRIFYGIYKTDGMRVAKGDVLVKQPDTSYYPGMNVAIMGHSKWLYALTPGTVKLSREKVDLDFEHPWVQEVDGWRSNFKDVPVYKLCFNVVADEPVGKFRLKQLI